jgi:hypothetical protein
VNASQQFRWKSDVGDLGDHFILNNTVVVVSAPPTFVFGMEEHEGHFAELLQEAQSHIDHLIKETYVAPQNAMEHWAGLLLSSLLILLNSFSIFLGNRLDRNMDPRLIMFPYSFISYCYLIEKKY